MSNHRTKVLGAVPLQGLASLLGVSAERSDAAGDPQTKKVRHPEGAGHRRVVRD
jgi:hypothetical protein